MMVLYCLPHGLVVHVPFWSSPDSLGPQGDFVKCVLYVSLMPNYNLIL